MRSLTPLLGAMACLMASTVTAGAANTPPDAAPCPIPNDPVLLLETLWPLADSDDDNKLSASEIDALYAGGSELLLQYGDANDDGKISLSEARALLTLLPIDFLSYVDSNGDQVLTFDEVSGYATQEQFNQVDINDNGILDCGDVEGGQPEGEVIVEGEWIPEGEPNGPCPLPRDFQSLLPLLWPVVDADASGGLTLAEVKKFYAELDESLFAMVDLDGSGEVTIEELQQIVVILGDGGVSDGSVNSIPGPFIDLLGQIDTNGNSLIEWAEVSQYTDEQTFQGLDANNNGVIDCGDFETVEPEGELPEPCRFVDFFANAFGAMDTNNDGAVTKKEFADYAGMLGAPIDFSPAFKAADMDNDEVVTAEEFKVLLERCGGGGVEGEQPVSPCEFLLLFGPDVYPTYDDNNDGRLTFGELPVINFFAEPAVTPEEAFAAADLNGDDAVDAAEFEGIRAQCGYGLPDPCELVYLYGTDWSAFDWNNDGKIGFDEIPIPDFAPPNGGDDPAIGYPSYIDVPALFQLVDRNGDQFIDAEELAALLEGCGIEGESEGGREGEPEGLIEGAPDDIPLCALVPLLQSLFPLLDADDNGVVTLSELTGIGVQVGVLMPNHEALFELADRDNSGGITPEEARHLLTNCYGGEGGNPGEGETAPEGELPPPDWTDTVPLERYVRGNGYYQPGRELIIEVRTFPRPPRRDLTPLRIEEVLPAGWTLTRVIESNGARLVPDAGAQGTLAFEWDAPLTLPGVRVVYGIVAAEVEGPQVITGHAITYDESGEPIHGPVTATAIGEGWSDEVCHSGDYDRDWTFSLSELLRIVQFFNVGHFACADETEDGFRPGISIALNACPPHAGDVDADWAFELNELLRIIQFYNSQNGAYQYAEDAATEDGYLPGMFELK